MVNSNDYEIKAEYCKTTVNDMKLSAVQFPHYNVKTKICLRDIV